MMRFGERMDSSDIEHSLQTSWQWLEVHKPDDRYHRNDHAKRCLANVPMAFGPKNAANFAEECGEKGRVTESIDAHCVIIMTCIMSPNRYMRLFDIILYSNRAGFHIENY